MKVYVNKEGNYFYHECTLNAIKGKDPYCSVYLRYGDKIGCFRFLCDFILPSLLVPEPNLRFKTLFLGDSAYRDNVDDLIEIEL